MSKPDWKDAPAWANYLAMDEDGYWLWYESKPSVSPYLFDEWDSRGEEKFSYAATSQGWKDSLEQRP